MLGMLIGSVISLCWAESFKKRLAETGFYFTVSFIIISQEVITVVRNKDLEGIFESLTIVKKTNSESWMHEYSKKNAAFCWKLIVLFKYAVGAVCLIYFDVPFMMDVVAGMIGGWDAQRYMVPIPFTEWLGEPDSRVRSLKLYAVNLLTVVWLQLVGASCVAIQASFLLCVLCVVSHLDVLRTSLLRVGPDLDLRSAVALHQQLIKLTGQLNDFFGLQFAIMIFISSLSLCLSGYTAIVHVKKNVMVTVSNLIITLFLMSLLCFLCLLGEYLKEKNEQVYTAVMELPWYRTSNFSKRREVSFIMLQASKKMQIDYKGLVPINANSFAQLVNASYSYFMILMSME